jgi:radical SAM protein with 4Fe4S-binding SPASM domain
MIIDSIDECIVRLKSEYNIVGIINCDNYKTTSMDLYEQIRKLHRIEYSSQDRIIFSITKDWFKNSAGLMLQSIQSMLNVIDISNFFVCIVTTNHKIESEYAWVLNNISTDTMPIHLYHCQGSYQILSPNGQTPFTKYQAPTYQLDNLSIEHKKLLFESDSFCMMPWVSLMVHPTSQVFPCCESTDAIGDCSTTSLKDIWNSNDMKKLRVDMLNGKTNKSCNNCHTKERLGGDSYRNFSNREFFHHTTKLDQTHADGTLSEFELNYIDIRFSNLCNLACRSCNTTLSTSWHQPAVVLGMINGAKSPMLIAGKNQSDIYQQILDTIDTVEKIYFAGGEPLMIDQFYQIVEELDRRGKHNIELVYNTNMTRSSLKNKSIFDTWKNFKKISIGASLDGEGERGEYLRTGAKWEDVVSFRKEMLERRPDIDFYISATVYICNMLHLPDFHQSWVDQGLIQPKDFNVQLLHDPAYLSADSAPEYLKQQIREKYSQHLEWLRPKDNLGRAVSSFESALNYINVDKPFDANLFWQNTNKLDAHHNHALLDVFPELADLPKQNYKN